MKGAIELLTYARLAPPMMVGWFRLQSEASTYKVIFLSRVLTQIREQMSGPEISLYEKSILGCGLCSGLDCGIKGSGPIMSNF